VTQAGAVLPGVVLAGVVGLTAHVIARLLFPYALAVGFEVPIAMFLGLFLVNLVGAAAWATSGVQFTIKYILGLGIVLLGLRLDLESVSEIGSKAFWLVLLTIGGGCAFAILAGRRLRVRRTVALLVGVGSTICGNSAILATAPVLGADERETSFALATITLVGTFAVFVLPLIGHALGLNVLTYGVWSGASIPDTAQTVASSAVYSTVARDVAILVKLVRTAMLAPVLLLVAWGWSRRGDRARVSASAARRGIRKAFPFFLVGFVALAAVRTERLVDPEKLAAVDEVTRACFVVALAALGLRTRVADLRALGIRPFLLGLGTSTLLAVGSLPLIIALGIGPARTAVVGAVDPRPLGAWTPVCEAGSPPAFASGFVTLSDALGRVAGRPLGCSHLDRAGNAVQRTTQGTATLTPMGTATFSDRVHTWSVVKQSLLEWRGVHTRPPSDPARSAAVSRDPSQPLPSSVPSLELTARLLASGIPRAGALSPVGTFLPGGPIHDDLGFAAFAQPGRVLASSRLLVASSSNFGERRARSDLAPGSILSLSISARTPLAVPATFGKAGGRVSALHGAVQIYTAEAPAFVNRLTTPRSATAAMPAVSNPLGISINNAFGRPWFASSPAGPSGIGAESVLDPDGRPLADAPSQRAGGVFARGLTNRRPQLEPGGLRTGAVANALLGASPDASGKAVFAVATANGAIEQVHVQDGVDGLAPPGTIAPLAQAHDLSGAPTRVGMVFNWIPDRFLYVSDPVNNAIVKLHLGDDFQIFHVLDSRRLRSPFFSEPIDLAPAVPEIANPGFASNTTLAGGADLYVANRGSGTIVRLRQDGRVRARARIYVPGYGVVGPGLVNGIAVSPDARTLFVSLSSAQSGGARLSGSIVRIPAFGAP
jgi:uncharacterized integral membrane protein (TIGR00698 family)